MMFGAVTCFLTHDGRHPRWDDGNNPEHRPGAMYWGNYDEEKDGYCIFGWSNCDGKHLHIILPNGAYWAIDSRAANCTMKEDAEHRCWIRHGEPPDVTVDKNGNTCQAGGGSVMSSRDEPPYHGFLQSGVLTAG